jgi:Universal stress protein family
LRKASLIAVHAWPPPRTVISRAGSPAPDLAAIEAEAARRLAGLLDNWRKNYPDVPVSQAVVRDRPGRVLVGLSGRADLVVIGRHASRPGLPGPGSVRHAALNHALGPVAVVPWS